MLKQVIRNNKGFSLVELMVVVAIIGILASIGIPQITKYMGKARQSEAKTNLSAIYTSNKAFFAEYMIYDNRFDVMGYRPEGRLRYNVGWGNPAAGRCGNLQLAGYATANPAGNSNTQTHCAIGANNCTLLATGAQAINNSNLVCNVGGANSFTAAAAGVVGSNAGTVDRWTMTDIKILTNTFDGTN